MSLTPGTRLGPYEVIAAIGAGGMGEVYRAKDTRLDRDVAVKVLPAGSIGDAQAEARFDREARAIAGLSHPNICALYDVGRLRVDDASGSQGREVSYLVMELLEGETLHQRLTRGSLEIGALVDHGINLADALETAHARGMLHRDLKPGNLFLTARGQIKILDFGLAKALNASSAAARPSWSIDGRSLLVLGFSRLAGQSRRSAELVVIDVATGTETRTVPLEKIDTIDAAWLDDRHALVNGVLPGKTPALYRADLVTGALDPVTQDLTKFVGVSLTADRQAAVTTRVDQRSSIWVGDGAGGAMTEIVPGGSAYASSVALDRVGGLVYGAATTSGTGVFTIGPGQRAPSPVVDNGTDPKITGDGKTIVFQRDGDKPGLYRVNADGAGLAILVEGSASNGLILPDDRTVLYISTRSGIQTLWSVPLSGGPSRELLHRLLYSGNGTLSASPDGHRLKLLAGPVHGRPAALVCDLPDCTNPRDFAVPPLAQWTSDSRGMAFSDSTDPRNIWVQPIDGSARHPLTKFTEKTIIDFAWSPDGKRLAITRGTSLADIVLIKGIR